MEQTSRPALYLSIPHPCSYLPEQTASTLFVDPHVPVTTELYADLNRRGFRRSGDLVYRPHCAGCTACVPVRIPSAAFTPNRSQRRTWRRNTDIEVVEKPPVFDKQHFELFLRYQADRHPDGGMNSPDPQRYLRFLASSHVETRFFELHAEGRLLGVAVVDVLPDGLSAMYTFYEPAAKSRALGVYSVLWQIERARRHRLPWVYLGYWISNSPKMAYKASYRPLEAYREGRWRRLDPSVFCC
ncbi:MAG: arginyltransferase [Acidiferrobacteraceae bacterium]